MENITAMIIDGLVYLVLIGVILKGILMVLNTVLEFKDHTARQQQATSILVKLGLVSVLTVGVAFFTGYYTDNFSYFFS